MNDVTWAQTQVSAGDAAWPGSWEAPPQTGLEPRGQATAHTGPQFTLKAQGR